MCGPPEQPWRRTMTSGFIACRLRAVSSSVSPFTVEEVDPEMLMTSAESRFPASSKLVRVRVDGSRNKLMTVLPRNVGTFLIGRSLISTKVSARSRIWLRSCAERSAIPRRCFTIFALASSRFSLSQHDAIEAAQLGKRHLHRLVARGLHRLAHEVGLDRQLAVPAIDQRRELHRARPAEVHERVERGADGAPR